MRTIVILAFAGLMVSTAVRAEPSGLSPGQRLVLVLQLEASLTRMTDMPVEISTVTQYRKPNASTTYCGVAKFGVMTTTFVLNTKKDFLVTPSGEQWDEYGCDRPGGTILRI